jgi:hypothetical protein
MSERLATAKFGVDSNLTALIRQLQEKHKIILSVFGNPYALNQLGDLSLCQVYSLVMKITLSLNRLQHR